MRIFAVCEFAQIFKIYHITVEIYSIKIIGYIKIIKKRVLKRLYREFFAVFDC